MNRIIQRMLNTKATLENAVKNIFPPQTRKRIKYGLAIFLILAFIPEIYIVPYYFAVIKPAGESEFIQILETVQSLNSTEDKVDAISDWQENNFTNIYGIQPNFSLDLGWYPLLGTSRYPVYYNASNQQPVKIRALFSPFTNDPYWITYFHCGACGELAELFYFITNKSHIESRMVNTKGEDHAWVEVKIHDTWMYFDPTLVEIFHRNPEYRDRWFGEPKNFESSWTWNVSRVTVSATDEDLTKYYTAVLNVSIRITATKRIEIFKYDTGKQKWISLLSRDVAYSENETIEVIQLGESNRYKIEALSVNGYLPIRNIQEQEFFLNTTGNVSYTLNPKDGRLDPDYALICLEISLIILSIEIIWLWKIIQKRKNNKK